MIKTVSRKIGRSHSVSSEQPGTDTDSSSFSSISATSNLKIHTNLAKRRLNTDCDMTT